MYVQDIATKKGSETKQLQAFKYKKLHKKGFFFKLKCVLTFEDMNALGSICKNLMFSNSKVHLFFFINDRAERRRGRELRGVQI